MKGGFSLPLFFGNVFPAWSRPGAIPRDWELLCAGIWGQIPGMGRGEVRDGWDPLEFGNSLFHAQTRLSLLDPGSGELQNPGANPQRGQSCFPAFSKPWESFRVGSEQGNPTLGSGFRLLLVFQVGPSSDPRVLLSWSGVHVCNSDFQLFLEYFLSLE